jgi:hypothetical protein
MRPFVPRAAALAALLVTAACADRSSPVEPGSQTRPAVPAGAPSSPADDQPRHERLARRLALALADAEFRRAVFQSLQQSRMREGKVHFQHFLGDPQGPRLHRLAQLALESDDGVAEDLAGAAPLELYLPVPAHRRAWQGDENILVATALGDHDIPVAFDSKGRRQLLDPDSPPDIPVLALGRAELGFDAAAGPSAVEVYDEDPNGGGGSPGETGLNGSLTSSPGLYMTYARINSSFEGWLKGAPEFEVHILGQDEGSNAMRSYQCAGESAGAPYQYNQDETEWHGNVLLFSQAQLDDYKAAHPGQAVRILVLEDDDTRCVIKTDSARVARFFAQIAASYGSLTGGRDTLISVKTFRKASTLINLFKALWSAIKTQDEIVGTAIEDSVAREYFSGANWIIKGENTVTHGALRLEMR